MSERSRSGIAELFFATFAALAICCSLSAGAQTATKRPVAAAKPKEALVQGQVFVVTEEGTNVKLALVYVSAFDELEFDRQFLQGARLENDVRVKLLDDVHKARREREAAAAAYESAGKARIAANRVLSQANGTPGQEAAKRAQEAAQKVYTDALEADRNARFNYLTAARAEELGKSPRNFIQSLKQPVAHTKSDADGYFDLVLPEGVYVLTALGKRRTRERDDVYEWIVKVDARRPNVKLMLSNDNMTNTNCEECISPP
jgi:hypothetical protein